MHTHLKIVFKWVLHFSTLVATRFDSSKKLFQAAINTTTLQASILLNVLPPARHTMFKIKALRLVSSVQCI